MSSDPTHAERVRQYYGETKHDPTFEDLIQAVPAASDADLAELIEADGRSRIRLRLGVALSRYLDSIPDLAMRTDPLDAAIDMALRFKARSGRPDQEAIDQLVQEYPQLEGAIRDAGALSHAIWSTAQVRRTVSAPPSSPSQDLPADFGPVMEDGRARYELKELIGEGAFGEVYLAEDRRLSEKGRPAHVAIKILYRQGDDPWERQRHIDEATKARRVNHPNVVRVLDRGVSERDEGYIVSEYVEGGDLTRWERRSRSHRSIGDAVDLMIRIARGVHAAHMAGLVHCDLKPHNILVTGEGEPKVADFGIAVRQEEEADPTSPTYTGSHIQGNLAFISPEQFGMLPGAFTVPSDLYALGGILYWLLTGRLPNGATPEEVRKTHHPVDGRHEPPSMLEFRPEVDRDLEAICRRTMEWDPVDRYGSAAELANDLDTWCQRRPLMWTRPSTAWRLRLGYRRNPRLAVALGAIVIVSVSIGSLALNQRMQAQRQIQIRAEAMELFGLVIGSLGENEKDHPPEDMLKSIWVFEYLLETQFLDGPADDGALWNIREKSLRDILENSYAKWGRDTTFLDPLLMESILGFWLVIQSDHAEAIPLLESNLARMTSRLALDDPWLLVPDILLQCARADRLMDPASSGIDPGESLEQARRFLEETNDRVSTARYGSPLHRIVIVKMQRLYGPDLLDASDRAKEIEALLAAIDTDEDDQ